MALVHSLGKAVGLWASEQDGDEKEPLSSTTRRETGAACTKAFLRTSRAALQFLIPSFISASQPTSDPLRSTAFLDGLRGVASWCVVNHHLVGGLYKTSGANWGQDGRYHFFMRFPGFSLLFNGHFAVGLFFVISGFALSISPIEAMRRSPRDPGTAMKKLASAAFRRPIRLFLPSWISTFLSLVLLRLHYMSAVKARIPEFETIIDAWFPVDGFAPVFRPTIWHQLMDWIRQNMNMLIIFQDYKEVSTLNTYNLVLWTVSVEFRASLMLYITHAALFFIRPRARTAIVVGLMTFGVAIHAYDYPLFLAGHLMAEYYREGTTEGRKKLSWSIFWWLVFLLGVYLGSYPFWLPQAAPLHSWLVPFTPFGFKKDYRFWHGLGGCLMLLAITRTAVLIKFLCTAPIQYLGKISFAVYLVHLWTVQGIGEIMFFHAWSLTGKANVVLEMLGFCIGYSIMFAILLCVADVFWRAADKPSVDFAVKVQKWLFQEA